MPTHNNNDSNNEDLATTLLTLPNEIIALIIKHLDIKSIIHLCLSCKRMFDAINLKYLRLPIDDSKLKKLIKEYPYLYEEGKEITRFFRSKQSMANILTFLDQRKTHNYSLFTLTPSDVATSITGIMITGFSYILYTNRELTAAPSNADYLVKMNNDATTEHSTVIPIKNKNPFASSSTLAVAQAFVLLIIAVGMLSYLATRYNHVFRTSEKKAQKYKALKELERRINYSLFADSSSLPSQEKQGNSSVGSVVEVLSSQRRLGSMPI